MEKNRACRVKQRLVGSLVRGHWRYVLGVGAALVLLSLSEPINSIPSHLGTLRGAGGLLELPLGWLLFL